MTDKKPPVADPATSIPARIQETKSKLAAARSRAASAMLDGEDLADQALIKDLEAHLSVLESAEALAVHRSREAAHKAAMDALAEEQRQGRILLRERTAAIQAAEMGLREFVEQMSTALEKNAKVAGIVHGLTGRPPPGSVHAMEFPRRLSDRACTILSEIRGKDGIDKFGALRWNTPPLFRSKQSWASEEARLIKQSLDAILGSEE
ncbi:hypothetical protein [Roseibium album]|uniref:hypothetical protein n=1 Tax=Roseibium album TaxID=311410 RepID=UPI0032973179